MLYKGFRRRSDDDALPSPHARQNYDIVMFEPCVVPATSESAWAEAAPVNTDITMVEPVPYVFLIKNAVDAGFLAYVRDLTAANLDLFEANHTGENRKFYKMDQVIPEGDQVLFDMKQRLAAHFDLGEYVVPPNLQDFLSYITDGGAIHAHTDPDLPGLRHVRINVLITQTAGCVPLMEDIPLAVEVGDAWLNLASQCSHATTVAEGPGYRSALSFGYQIDPDRGDELYAQHLEWREGIMTSA